MSHGGLLAASLAFLLLETACSSGSKTVEGTTPTIASSSNAGGGRAASSSGLSGLVICDNDSFQLLSDSGGDVAEQALVNLSQDTSCEHIAGLFGLSPDRSKVATTSSISDGSTVAGYTLISRPGSFVDLSGHQNNSFSGATVNDRDPMFNPVSGDLWWQRDGDLLSVPETGGAPIDHGPGSLGSFTSDGQPLPGPMISSPDGSLRAVWDAGLFIGSSDTLTPACFEQAVLNRNGGSATEYCTGATQVNLGSSNAQTWACQAFNGFVTNTSFVCLAGTTDGSQHQYDLAQFNGSGDVTSLTPLTPISQLELAGGVVSPDGKQLWFTSQHDTSGDLVPQSVPISLYVVPTSGFTASPRPTSVRLTYSLNVLGEVAGWLWQGKVLPAAVG